MVNVELRACDPGSHLDRADNPTNGDPTEILMAINGNTLIGWGYKPGAWFKQAIAAVEAAQRNGADEAALRAIVDTFAPPPSRPSV